MRQDTNIKYLKYTSPKDQYLENISRKYKILLTPKYENIINENCIKKHAMKK